MLTGELCLSRDATRDGGRLAAGQEARRLWAEDRCVRGG